MHIKHRLYQLLVSLFKLRHWKAIWWEEIIPANIEKFLSVSIPRKVVVAVARSKSWGPKVEAEGQSEGEMQGWDSWEGAANPLPPARGSTIFHSFGHWKRPLLNKKCQLWMVWPTSGGYWVSWQVWEISFETKAQTRYQDEDEAYMMNQPWSKMQA